MSKIHELIDTWETKALRIEAGMETEVPTPASVLRKCASELDDLKEYIKQEVLDDKVIEDKDWSDH